jgi:O-antigen/teichoic acid export membrane protein
MRELRQKALTGIKWSMVAQIGRQTIIFIVGIVLARLLSPREFGLIAMITVITGFATQFSELGLGAAIIQKERIQQEQLSTIFWLNVTCGVLLMALFAAASPLIAAFYGEPSLVPLTVFISTTFLISAFRTVPNALLMKSLDFRTLAIVEIPSTALAGAVAIAMAVSGLDTWSLATQAVLASLLGFLFTWQFTQWRPRLVFRWSAISGLVGFGGSLLSAQTLSYLARNLDQLLIGKYLGDAALGLYHRAYSLLLFPATNISHVLSRVMFPTLSVMQSDKPRVKRTYMRMTRMIALATFPLMAGLLVVAESFVVALLGPHWIQMVPILQILCLVGAIQSIGTLNGNLYLSQGRADLQLKVVLVVQLNVVVGVVVGLQWGLIGVTLGYAAAAAIGSYPSFFFAGRLVGIRFTELLANLSAITSCTAAMALTVWAIGLLLPDDWSAWAFLAIQVPAGILVYAALVHVFKLTAYREAREIVAEQWARLSNH